MKETFDDLPGWIFDVQEVSAGVYSVEGTDEAGRSVARKGAIDSHALGMNVGGLRR